MHKLIIFRVNFFCIHLWIPQPPIPYVPWTQKAPGCSFWDGLGFWSLKNQFQQTPASKYTSEPIDVENGYLNLDPFSHSLQYKCSAKDTHKRDNNRDIVIYTKEHREKMNKKDKREDEKREFKKSKIISRKK